LGARIDPRLAEGTTHHAFFNPAAAVRGCLLRGTLPQPGVVVRLIVNRSDRANTMTNRTKLRLSRLTIGLAIALAAAPVFAQQTSSALGGRVQIAEGAPVAGAEVIIVHTPSGTTSRASTDESGRFIARGLRVGGPYSVSIIKDGYRTETQENVFLELGEAASVSVDLLATTQLDSIEVTAPTLSDDFSPYRMGTGTNVSREQIDQLPSIARNIQDYVRLDPRIAQTDKERTEISAGGQNVRFNNIRVDGVTINDGFGLGGNNLTTARQPISIDAIEAINISLANYDVALSGYTGANVDSVTKSGTNDFTGTVYGLYRDGDWARDDIIAGSFFSPPEEEQTYGVTFGGPLIEDTLFFFVAYENFERTLGAPSSLPPAVSNAQIDAVRNVAQSVWGFDAGDFALPGALAFEVEDLVARVDWNINDNHRAYFRYNKSEQTEPFLRSIGTRNLSLSSYWHTNNVEFESGVVQLFSDWNDTFSTEFKLGRSTSSSLWDLNAALPQIRVCWGPGTNVQTCAGSDSIFLGAEQFRHVNILESEVTTAQGSGFLFLGDHEVKFGVEYQENDALNLFGRDVFGVYAFGGATFEAALANFAAGTPTRYNARYPINGDISSLAASIVLENLGFYLQDTWSVSSNLSITYGLRYDEPSVPQSPPPNPVASGIFGFDNTKTIDGNGLLQPRIGFNYTLDSERPTQFRGGIGLFSGAAANVWLANPFQNNGGITLGEVFVADGRGIRFNPDPNNQPGIPTAPTGSVGGPLDLVDGDLRQPAVWKANLAFDHELPWYGIVASAEGLFTEVKEALFYQNLNLGTPAPLVGQDGRLMYWTNPATATGPQGRRNTQFTDVTVIRPTDKGSSQQFTFSLAKPVVENWSWSLGYTFTNASEVSPLTSSQAISNWANRFALNPNTEDERTSITEIRDRFIATLGYETMFFEGYKTSMAMFYEGRSGRPFSYSFINDANGDGRVNDLLFVPAAPGDVIFTGGAAMEAAFFDFLQRNPDLARYAGGVATANGDQSPFTHSFDLRFTQQLPGFYKDHKSEIWIDIQNVGNLINKDWGQIEEIAFPYGQGILSYAGIDTASGRYRYNFSEANVRDVILRDNRGESRWSAQIGFRYRF